MTQHEVPTQYAFRQGLGPETGEACSAAGLGIGIQAQNAAVLLVFEKDCQGCRLEMQVVDSIYQGRSADSAI